MENTFIPRLTAVVACVALVSVLVVVVVHEHEHEDDYEDVHAHDYEDELYAVTTGFASGVGA